MLRMEMEPANVDEYIAIFPEAIRSKLESLREAVRKAAPGTEEIISYNMPAYKLNGILVYFAAYKSHIGFYPTATGIEAFKKELSGYKTSRGTVQFPLDEKLPIALITKIVKYRVKENLDKKKKK
jgi:uncharacterized protein YdhG (YjbR/CyaY superfamily)